MTDADISDVSKGLFVFIPGLPPRTSSERPPWKSFVERLRADLAPTWRVEVFEHGLTATSREDLDQVVRRLAAQIRDWAGELSTDIEAPDGIIVAGHSFGGVLARAAFLQDASTPETDGHRWTERVRRMVLLGSPNSGYRTDAPGTPLRWRLAYALATPFFDFTFEKVMAGGYWITDLRLRWLEHYRTQKTRPRVIQVLGTSDHLVTHTDILDQKFMPRAKVYEIPGADHPGLIALDRALSSDRLYLQLKAAILGRPDEEEDAEVKVESAPTAFILHGIRASALGTWVDELGAQFASKAAGPDQASEPGAPQVQVVSPDTGYFSAMEFALPGTRRRKVHEFLKLYGDAYASRDPNQFVFAGHSNGTYMMAQALDRVPAMRFKKIYLAGTVLPRRYDWQRLFDNKQIGQRVEKEAEPGQVRVEDDGNPGEVRVEKEWKPGQVRVDRATRDIPVGILCSWLRGLGSSDVGTAGVDGFENVSFRAFDQERTIEGGHGAALKTVEQLTAIADYLADVPIKPSRKRAAQPDPKKSWKQTLQRIRALVFTGASRFFGLRLIAWIILSGLGVLAGTGLVKLGQAKGPRVAIGTGAAAGVGFWALLRSI